jgi:hypothetical protein
MTAILKAESPKWKLLNVKTIKGAAYNPPNRTEATKLVKLRKSMASIGMLYPILVDRDNVIIDGHRRVACAKQLDWDTIQAIVVESDDRDAIYASVNDTAAKMHGSDALSVWLEEPGAVSARLQKLHREMKDTLGVGMVRQIAENRLSASVYLTAKRVGRYCGQDDAETLKTVTRWLMNTALVGIVRKAMETGLDPAKLLKAAREDKAILLSVN